MAGKRLTEAEKKAILDDLSATMGTPDGSFAKIAKRHGRGYGTIKRIADKAGLSVTEAARSRVKSAAETNSQYFAQKRQDISKRFVELTDRVLDLLDRSLDGKALIEDDSRWIEAVATASDFRAMMSSAHQSFAAHLAAEKFDVDVLTLSAVDRFIDHMLTAGED